MIISKTHCVTLEHCEAFRLLKCTNPKSNLMLTPEKLGNCQIRSELVHINDVQLARQLSNVVISLIKESAIAE